MHANVRSAVVILASLVVIGCGEQQSAAPPPPPPPPPAPVPVDVATLLQIENADPRVQFPDERAPMDEDLARAVVGLASGLASGDADAVSSRLTPGAKQVLEQLQSRGEFADATSPIEAVRVTELTEERLVLAVQDPRGAYPLAWQIQRTGGEVLFDGAAAPDVVLATANQFDGGIPEPALDGAASGRRAELRIPSVADMQAAMADPAMVQATMRYAATQGQWMTNLSPAGFHVNWVLNKRFQDGIGLVDVDSEQGRAMFAQAVGMTPDAVADRIDAAAQAVSSGEQPTAAEVFATVESYTELPAFPQSKSAVINAIADILNAPAEDITALFDTGAAEGPSPFTTIGG